MEQYTRDGITLWTREGDADDRGVIGEVQTYVLPDYPVKTIVDGGAHIGAATAYFKQRWPDAQVIAVEPDLDNYNVLVMNVLPGSIALRARLAYTDDAVVEAIHPDHTTCHRIVPRGSVLPEGYRVATAASSITLAQILHNYRWPTLDLLKLDIEGGEVDVIVHEQDDVLKRIRFIVGEFHDGYDNFMTGIGARLQTLGFEVTGTTDPLAHATFNAVNKGAL